MTRTVPNHADALSFMARRGRTAGGGIDNWIVEGTGNFSKDCELGRALAREFLDYVGEYTTNGNVLLLSHIVVDMVAKNDTPKGVIIGFMNAVGEMMALGARLMFDLNRAEAATPSTLDTRVDEWKSTRAALYKAIETLPKGKDPDEEYEAYNAAETALLVHPCHSLAEVRTKARVVLENEEVLFEAIGNCLIEKGGEPMMAGFLRSLLGETTKMTAPASQEVNNG